MKANTLEQALKINAQLTEEVSELRKQVAHLIEQNTYLLKKLYGKSSEKDIITDEDQSEDEGPR
ncbi:MAG: hypothetical protein NC114_11875 [Ruminococcus flavefaciens]|nr:hypothetical protein [Muribaculum sp.]MCM1532949.1 hypothetical protein [Ruminococcus flavefaciens]